jgi:hypothetical protein
MDEPKFRAEDREKYQMLRTGFAVYKNIELKK